MPNQVHQIGRVLTVVYGESGSDPDLVGIFPQKPSADTVERSGPGQRFGHNAGAAAHDLSCDTLHAPGHFGRGAAGDYTASVWTEDGVFDRGAEFPQWRKGHRPRY